MALRGVEALLFDVFGTVVDWQGSVAAELKTKNEGLADGTCRVDLYKFAAYWTHVARLQSTG